MAQLTDAQRTVLIQTLLGEAANQGKSGLEAVAHVIRNRAESGQYPSDPMAVALQPKQFSAWNDPSEGGNDLVNRQPGDPGWDSASEAIDAVFGGLSEDPTGGAMHYWAPQGMPGGREPSWADALDDNGRVAIGDHVFLPTMSLGTNAPKPSGGFNIGNMLSGGLSFLKGGANQATAALNSGLGNASSAVGSAAPMIAKYGPLIKMMTPVVNNTGGTGRAPTHFETVTDTYGWDKGKYDATKAAIGDKLITKTNLGGR
jgi:hypothetical protein